MSKKKVYSLNLTQEVMEAIKVQAVREGISVSEKVDRIVRQEIEGNTLTEIPYNILPLASTPFPDQEL